VVRILFGHVANSRRGLNSSDRPCFFSVGLLLDFGVLSWSNPLELRIWIGFGAGFSGYVTLGGLLGNVG